MTYAPWALQIMIMSPTLLSPGLHAQYTAFAMACTNVIQGRHWWNRTCALQSVCVTWFAGTRWSSEANAEAQAALQLRYGLTTAAQKQRALQQAMQKSKTMYGRTVVESG